MLKKYLLALVACSFSLFANANVITVGSNIPAVSISQGGEIFVTENDDVTYLPWNTEQLLGKVRVIQAIAGRSGAKAMNNPLMEAITASHFPEEKYQTTTVVNQDDAIWGTSSFVKSSAEDGKRDFAWSSMVLDETGVLAKTWQLEEKTSTIIVQDKAGKVLFNQTGALTQEQIEQVLALIKQSL